MLTASTRSLSSRTSTLCTNDIIHIMHPCIAQLYKFCLFSFLVPTLYLNINILVIITNHDLMNMATSNMFNVELLMDLWSLLATPSTVARVTK